MMASLSTTKVEWCANKMLFIFAVFCLIFCIPPFVLPLALGEPGSKLLLNLRISGVQIFKAGHWIFDQNDLSYLHYKYQNTKKAVINSEEETTLFKSIYSVKHTLKKINKIWITMINHK